MKKYTDSIIKLIALLRDCIVPSTLYRYKLGHINKKFQARNHVVRYEVQPDVHIDVFWKALPKWRGPGLSLFIYGDEVLRFDCFGKGDGHYHVDFYAPWATKNNKLFFTEPTVEGQIDRTLYELKTNLNYYLQRNPESKIRNITIDSDKLDNICEKIRESMNNLLMTIPELQELKNGCQTAI